MATSNFTPTTFHAAIQDLDLSGFTNVVLKLVGSIVLIILIVRLVNAYGKRQWGELVTEILAFIVIGFVVYFPQQALALLKSIMTSIFGS